MFLLTIGGHKFSSENKILRSLKKITHHHPLPPFLIYLKISVNQGYVLFYCVVSRPFENLCQNKTPLNANKSL